MCSQSQTPYQNMLYCKSIAILQMRKLRLSGWNNLPKVTEPVRCPTRSQSQFTAQQGHRASSLPKVTEPVHCTG